MELYKAEDVISLVAKMNGGKSCEHEQGQDQVSCKVPDKTIPANNTRPGGGGMKRKSAEVFPPSVFIFDELEARGWDAKMLVKKSWLKPAKVQAILEGKPITITMAKGLARAFGTSYQIWLNLQKVWVASLEIALEEFTPIGTGTKVSQSVVNGSTDGHEPSDSNHVMEAGGRRMKPRLLDLFCKAGGCTKGYQQAGFYVVGVDIEPQPHYCGDEFIQADALTLGVEFMRSFDAIHASPPCQAYSMASKQWRNAGKQYADLVEPTRKLIQKTGLPYVIENVPGAPLINPIHLNGSFFGIKVNRKRIFELSFDVPFMLIPKDPPSHFRMGRPIKEGGIITPVGHFSNVPYAKRQMGIDWMSQAELAEAIPPIYTKFIGELLIKQLFSPTEPGIKNSSSIVFVEKDKQQTGPMCNNPDLNHVTEADGSIINTNICRIGLPTGIPGGSEKTYPLAPTLEGNND